MKVTFEYNLEKDVWCLLNKGKSSSNSQTATKVYEELVCEYGEHPTEAETSTFIQKYISENSINVEDFIKKSQEDWGSIAEEFQKRAEDIFEIRLPSDCIAYFTINNRCPYSIEDNYFYVSLQSASFRKTVMHELWHFYTWYGLGCDQVERLGFEKYNDLKEALTVLLNVECGDLLSEGDMDKGYLKHQEVREKTLEFWEKDKNIKRLWEYLVTL